MIDSSSRDHHDSNNGQERGLGLDHDEVMVQSGVTEDVAPQRIGGRKENAGNEIQGFTLHRMPVNFPLSAGFLKQLTVSNFYRCGGAEGGGRTACMVSYSLENDSACCDALSKPILHHVRRNHLKFLYIPRQCFQNHAKTFHSPHRIRANLHVLP